MMEKAKFQGLTMSSAMAKVKRHLGEDAVILATRHLCDDTGRSFYEIEAARSGKHPGIMERRDGAEWGLIDPHRLFELVSGYSRDIMEDLVLHPTAVDSYVKMLKNGILESNARYLLKSALRSGEWAGGDRSLDERIIDEIRNNISVTEAFAPKADRVIAAFVGTTGVGKTTTIAKLAARLLFDDQRKVGLLSVDTYRIGAFEQLKIYADILGIPCFQAFSGEDLLSAMRRMEAFDVILIDTAGQSQYDIRRLNELASLLGGNGSIDCHLCIGASTRQDEMENTARHFERLGIKSHIFTKMDETLRYGSILNHLVKNPLPVSYLTTGQRVPEDIEKANSDSMARLLFNPEKLGSQGGRSWIRQAISETC